MLKKAIASLSILCALSLSAFCADAKPAKTAAQTKAATTAFPAVSASAATASKSSTSAAAPAVAEASTVVYIKSGSRYHVKGCQYLKNKGTAITVGDAMKQGYAPCNVCHAPKLKRPE